ncbi:hypothetical protein CBR_g41600 [Chara braunii]|uniref:Peptidase A2 domain-containing protein n=1 Tax=Chara braunii TaxID=69332 RepID=A0A388LW30_CHABU|nr:hypothetical protein CBR_g41600 [Chara braunii]|eukprot:GBG86537.1 hypothetical protein CBR_g41600 [Chara braunii]
MPPAPPAMFQIWQEKEVRCDIGVEEVGENEEVEQGRNAGTIKEEPILIESDDEIEEDCWNEPRKAKIGEDCWREARQTMVRMEDLVAKVGRYQQKLADMCEEVKEWRGKEPLVYLYDMGPGSQGGSENLPGVTIFGPTPRSGMAYRPPSRSGRVPHAVRIRAKGPVSPEEPAKDVPEPSGEKEIVDVPGKEEEEDDRLRKEEDEKAEQRAKKKGAKPDTDKASEGKKKKYVIRVEEGFDVEEIMDKILEGHNHLMNLKDVLASAPRLRDELKARLSRKMVVIVHLGTIIPKEAEWAEVGTKMEWKSVACGCLDVVVEGKTCTAMVDNGAEMNLIKEEHAVRLGIEIDRSDNGVLMGANSRSLFIGTASSVILEIGKVKGWAQAGVTKRYKRVDQKCRPVPVLVAEEQEVYYERERELIRQMRENAENGPCRITPETENTLTIEEPGFLTAQEEKLMVETIRGRHAAYAFSDDERGRLDVDIIPTIRIHTVPHEPWNLRGARYPNPIDEEKVVSPTLMRFQRPALGEP